MKTKQDLKNLLKEKEKGCNLQFSIPKGKKSLTILVCNSEHLCESCQHNIDLLKQALEVIENLEQQYKLRNDDAKDYARVITELQEENKRLKEQLNSQQQCKEIGSNSHDYSNKCNPTASADTQDREVLKPISQVNNKGDYPVVSNSDIKLALEKDNKCLNCDKLNAIYCGECAISLVDEELEKHKKEILEKIEGLGNIDFFRTKLEDLHKQSIMERSHYYVRSCVEEMLSVIDYLIIWKQQLNSEKDK